jgi:hypothetical protein
MVPIKYEAAVAMHPEKSASGHCYELCALCGQLQTLKALKLKVSVITCHCNRSFLSLQLDADVDVQSYYLCLISKQNELPS